MSAVPGGALAVAAKVAPPSVETCLVTVSVGRLTVITVAVVCVAAGLGAVPEVAEVLTDWLPELPLVMLPEGPVSVKALGSPATWPAAPGPPAVTVLSAMVGVLATAYLVEVGTVYGYA